MDNKPWEPHINQTMKNISIPLKTKCVVCKRVKQTSQFSTKQLNDLRYKVYKLGQAKAIPPEGLIRCRECTGAQNTEMQCTICLVSKPLEGFSLAQRSRKDTAVCLPCQEDLDETHPDDRKLKTHHDDTVSYAGEEYENDDRSEADASDIWLWDHSTGNYVTSNYSTMSGGVPLPPPSAASTSGRSSANVAVARQPPRQQPRPGAGLTRKNLARLSLYSPNSASNPYSTHSRDASVKSDANAAVSGAKEEWQTGRATKQRTGGDVSPPGQYFRAYDPKGGIHEQRRQQSDTESETASAYESSTASVETPRRGRASTRNDDSPPRAFARVRPQNKPLRRFLDDERPDLRPTPAKTRISTGVMDEVDSDDE